MALLRFLLKLAGKDKPQIGTIKKGKYRVAGREVDSDEIEDITFLGIGGPNGERGDESKK